jgi:2'-5' RNA ligase
MKRVFISIDIPESIKKEIRKIQDSLPEFYGKKTEPWNLHLTLKFLGEIPEEKIEEIKKRLNEIKFNRFEAEISLLGIFSENFIRIIWISIENCGELQKEIDNSLISLGFENEKRFMGHMTIARVKKIKDKKKFLEELKRIKIPELKFPVKSFHLKESVLEPEGPVYKEIETYLSS